MKKKHILLGVAGGLAVLLYFKFGKKKQSEKKVADNTATLRKDIPKTILPIKEDIRHVDPVYPRGGGGGYSYPPEIITIGENARPLIERDTRVIAMK